MMNKEQRTQPVGILEKKKNEKNLWVGWNWVKDCIPDKKKKNSEWAKVWIGYKADIKVQVKIPEADGDKKWFLNIFK